MTKKEAAKILSNGMLATTEKLWCEAFEMAIKALEQEPTIQDKQAESEKYQKAFDDGYANGYAQARFDYEQEDVINREVVKEALRNRIGESISECINAIPPSNLILCNDAISRKALLKKQYRIDDSATLSTRDVVNVEDIEDESFVIPSRYVDAIHAMGYREGYKDAEKYIRRKGYWIEEIDDYGEIQGWHCSNCYEDTGFTTDCKWDFCPKCGAEIVESQESEV